MNIEECIEQLKDLRLHCLSIGYEFDKDAEAIEYILTAYEEKCKELEKEKEKNNKIDEFCRKELAFERRLKRDNREPDEFNQGRFYVSENIRKFIKEE